MGQSKAAVAFALLACAGPGEAIAARLEFATKASYSSGDFGSGRTIRNVFQPSKLALKTGPFSLKADWGYWHTRHEMTDLRVGASYLFSADATEPFEILVHANAKVPTAEETQGFFSGAPDYGISLEAGRPIGPFFVFVETGLDDLGDGAGAQPDDVPFIASGISLGFSPALEAEIAYDWASAPFENMPDYRKANFKLAYRASDAVKLTFDAGRGFSDEADNWSVGLRISLFRQIGTAAARKSETTEGANPGAIRVEQPMRSHRDRFLSERHGAQALYSNLATAP